MTDIPPGWYRDAQGTTRWFDGNTWTEHTQGPQPPAPPVSSEPGPSAPGSSEAPGWTPSYATPPGATGPTPMTPMTPMSAGSPAGRSEHGSGSRGVLVVLGVISALLLVAIVVVAVLLLTGGEDSETDSAPDQTTGSTQDPETSAPQPSEEPTTAPPSTDPSETPSETPSQTPGQTPSDSPSEDPGSTPAGGSPEDVADRFMTAIFSGDCKTAKKYVAQGLLGAGGECAQQQIPPGLLDSVTFDVGKAEVDGDQATVPVTINAAGSDQPLPGSDLALQLARSGGEWRITMLEPTG